MMKKNLNINVISLCGYPSHNDEIFSTRFSLKKWNTIIQLKNLQIKQFLHLNYIFCALNIICNKFYIKIHILLYFTMFLISCLSIIKRHKIAIQEKFTTWHPLLRRLHSYLLDGSSADLPVSLRGILTTQNTPLMWI